MSVITITKYTLNSYTFGLQAVKLGTIEFEAHRSDFVDGHGEGHEGDDDDARGVIGVLVCIPEDDAEQLEDVEWVECLE